MLATWIAGGVGDRSAISLGPPRGRDTLVAEAGQALSSSQPQRLVLAPGLLIGVPVLVLDEPTAHLDPSTASELIKDVFSERGIDK